MKQKSYKLFKRCIDIIFSGMSLFILFPFFIIIALAIKFDSSGPVFYKQKRIGKNGVEFKMYKFRSMVVGAENMGAGLYNYENDPRVTRVGKFLRNTSIDELPQLINVLRGDMSIVGPRPPVVNELGDYNTLNKRYKKRFTVLPGITGLAQVEGRNSITWDRKVNYDNLYIELVKSKGLWIDFEIILRTILNIFKKKDIYEKKIKIEMTNEESAKAAEAEVIAKAHAKESEDLVQISD